MTDAFADGAREHVVSPIPGAGFGVRGDVGRDDAARKALEKAHVLTACFHADRNRRVTLRPIVRRMAKRAIGDVFHEISATRETLGRALKLDVGERTGARTDERRPTMVKVMPTASNRIRTRKLDQRIFVPFFIELVSCGVENQRA